MPTFLIVLAFLALFGLLIGTQWKTHTAVR